MEIGSEFYWKKVENNNSPKKVDIDYYFLGRMALKVILQELKLKGYKKVLFPSYFCESMIKPFYECGIEVLFYDVNFYNGKIQFDLKNYDDFDIFFAMHYFGYFQSNMEELINKMLEKNKIVIEDNTHSMFCKNIFNSDFVFGSIRKWLPTIAGGAIYKSMYLLNVKKEKPSELQCQKRLKAMKLKNEYVNTGKGNKNEYLKLYKEFNDYIEEENNFLDIDEYSKKVYESIKKNDIIVKRQENATYLHRELKRIGVKTISELREHDCPLFVPIICRTKNDRDVLHKKLIDHNIYCPLHWPKSDNSNSNIYDLEISLICDQRYNLDDMAKIIKIIKEK